MIESRDMLVKELDDRVAVFEQDKVLLKAALRKLQKEINEEAPKTKKLADDFRAAADEVQILKNEVKRIASSHTKEITRLQSTDSKLETAMRKAQSEMAMIGSHVDKLEERMASFAIARRDLIIREESCRLISKDTRVIEEECIELAATVGNYAMEHSDFKKLIEELETERSKLQEAKSNLTDSKKALVEEERILRETTTSIEEDIFGMKQIVNEWERKTKDLEFVHGTQLQTLKQSASNETAAIKTADYKKNQIDSLRRNLETKKADLEAKESELKVLLTPPPPPPPPIVTERSAVSISVDQEKNVLQNTSTVKEEDTGSTRIASNETAVPTDDAKTAVPSNASTSSPPAASVVLNTSLSEMKDKGSSPCEKQKPATVNKTSELTPSVGLSVNDASRNTTTKPMKTPLPTVGVRGPPGGVSSAPESKANGNAALKSQNKEAMSSAESTKTATRIDGDLSSKEQTKKPRKDVVDTSPAQTKRPPNSQTKGTKERGNVQLTNLTPESESNTSIALSLPSVPESKTNKNATVKSQSNKNISSVESPKRATRIDGNFSSKEQTKKPRKEVVDKSLAQTKQRPSSQIKGSKKRDSVQLTQRTSESASNTSIALSNPRAVKNTNAMRQAKSISQSSPPTIRNHTRKIRKSAKLHPPVQQRDVPLREIRKTLVKQKGFRGLENPSTKQTRQPNRVLPRSKSSTSSPPTNATSTHSTNSAKITNNNYARANSNKKPSSSQKFNILQDVRKAIGGLFKRSSHHKSRTKNIPPTFVGSSHRKQKLPINASIARGTTFNTINNDTHVPSRSGANRSGTIGLSSVNKTGQAPRHRSIPFREARKAIAKATGIHGFWTPSSVQQQRNLVDRDIPYRDFRKAAAKTTGLHGFWTPSSDQQRRKLLDSSRNRPAAFVVNSLNSTKTNSTTQPPPRQTQRPKKWNTTMSSNTTNTSVTPLLSRVANSSNSTNMNSTTQTRRLKKRNTTKASNTTNTTLTPPPPRRRKLKRRNAAAASNITHTGRNTNNSNIK